MLKGIVRCAYCSMPMWAQTYRKGNPYYKEHSGEYHRQRRLLEMELESLVVAGVNAAEEADNLIHRLPDLWVSANLGERRKLLLAMLDAVYVDAKKYKTIVAVKPKPPFVPILQVAVSRKESPIRILNEPIKGSSAFLVETGEG